MTHNEKKKQQHLCVKILRYYASCCGWNKDRWFLFILYESAL